MGHNDHIEDIRPELPHEAGKDSPSGFEPDDDWLTTADPDVRHEAMRAWFLTRYWDPANDTPYMSSEGGYIYIHGGPYDARKELEDRFGGVVSKEALLAVVEDVESEGTVEWAPIHTGEDYDADFGFEVTAREDPRRLFDRQLKEAEALAASEVDEPRRPLLRRLLYSSLIAALEAYLADTMSYWLSSDKGVFRRFVSSCGEFKDRKLTLAEIFDRMDVLEEDVKAYLQNQVWHRLDKVGPLMSASLAIALPPIGELMKCIVVRHDIVHRGGRTKDGDLVEIATEDLNALRAEIISFVDQTEASLRERFPVSASNFDDVYIARDKPYI